MKFPVLWSGITHSVLGAPVNTTCYIKKIVNCAIKQSGKVLHIENALYKCKIKFKFKASMPNFAKVVLWHFISKIFRVSCKVPCQPFNSFHFPVVKAA